MSRSFFFLLAQVNAAIKHFNVSYNGFADKGMIALAEALKVNSLLRELDVRWCIVHAGSAI